MQLLSIVLTLQAQETAVVPAQLGRSNYAATLAQLERIEPLLAQQVHGGSAAKPLTCSGLLNAGAATDMVTLAAGAIVRVRVTGLNEAVCAALHQALIDAPPPTWSLHRVPLRLVRATADAGDDRWAGSTDYAQLMAQAAREQGGAEQRRLHLHFASPTAFRSGGMTAPLPLPGLFFGSLLDRWNTFSPAPLDEDVRAAAQAGLALSHFRLESVPVAQKQQGLEIGSVGDVTYTYLGEDPYWLRLLRLLAAFALYSGAGIKTTMGMGQCVWRQ